MCYIKPYNGVFVLRGERSAGHVLSMYFEKFINNIYILKHSMTISFDIYKILFLRFF